ncbi:MAG: DMT family transporter [Pseudomonadota bacterium]
MSRPALAGPRLAAMTAAAMVAFAANSVLTRIALADGMIAADRFAAVRIASGAAMLVLLISLRSLWRDRASQRRQFRGERLRGGLPQGGLSQGGLSQGGLSQGGLFMGGLAGLARLPRPGWAAGVGLFVYMAGFSFAYLRLDTGTGALILFGMVQATMLGAGLAAGERLPALGWAGLALALAGLVALLSPGDTAPDALGALAMLAAGAGWGFYSLAGRGVADPLAATTVNLLACLLPLVALDLLIGGAASSGAGVGYAVASGAVASAIGYALWFAALSGLTASRAATVQLSVPVIAVLGGVVFLAEPVTLRLVLASLATLGGVALVVGAKTRQAAPH